MKKNKTFRLSEEAIIVLEKQESPTQYIEDLILQGKSKPVEDYIIEMLDKIYKAVGKKETSATPKDTFKQLQENLDVRYSEGEW